MLEGQQVWKREAGLDRIEIIAEMHAQRLHAGFDSKPRYSELYNNPRWPHTPEEHKLEIDVDVERLTLKIIFLSPRRRHVIHHRDGRPRSVRGRKSPKCHVLRRKNAQEV